MSRKYKIRDQARPYFVTFTTISWIDAFTRNIYRDEFVQSVKYCQKNKGLEVYSWCIMTNHVHMILGTSGLLTLEGIIRDLKSFTSRSIRKLMEEGTRVRESRDWMYDMMKEEGTRNPNNKDFQFWQQHSHPIRLFNNKIALQKLEYIHQNPVKAGFVDAAESWLYSSARDYKGGRGLIDVILLGS
jgi:REP element-mobilizing transposase RayT